MLIELNIIPGSNNSKNVETKYLQEFEIYKECMHEIYLFLSHGLCVLISLLQAVIRQFRAILNKLTPQKFQTLITQILQLPINSELRLKNAIDTIFEKVSV